MSFALESVAFGALSPNNLPQGDRGGAFGGRDLGSDLLGHFFFWMVENIEGIATIEDLHRLV